jgi:hypothetical protein
MLEFAAQSLQVAKLVRLFHKHLSLMSHVFYLHQMIVLSLLLAQTIALEMEFVSI